MPATDFQMAGVRRRRHINGGDKDSKIFKDIYVFIFLFFQLCYKFELFPKKKLGEERLKIKTTILYTFNRDSILQSSNTYCKSTYLS